MKVGTRAPMGVGRAIARAATLAASTLAAALAGCSPDAPPEPLPGAALRAEAEARIVRERDDLRDSLNHYGLVFAVQPDDFELLARQLVVRGDGHDIVMGGVNGIELHGGGVLRLMLDFWRPDGRAARLDDRVQFRWSTRPIALSELYRSHRRQIYLPVPGKASDEIHGQLPIEPQLPRMRFSFRPPVGNGTTADVDAYAFLSLLLEQQQSLDATWTNSAGQRLSVDLLLRNVRDSYLTSREVGDEQSDHSHLHLVPLLLAYHRARPDGSDPNDVKRRFLAVELRRDTFPEDGPSETLGHYAESLGHLLANPNIQWTRDERQQVRDWLRALEADRHFGPDSSINHVAHLVAGLRMIEKHQAKIE